MKNLRKNSGKTTGMEEPTLNPSRREGLQRRRKVKKAPSLREGRGWVIPPRIAAFRTWISAQVGCAPSEEAYLLSESATMLISRWLVNVSGISAISTKTSWSGSLLITDFRNRNDGRVLARLSVRGEGLGCRFDGDADAAAGTVDAAQWDFSRWCKTFGRWFDNPVWKPVCAYLPESARINGLLAAGSMWGTLLSGCHLRNWYDGSDLYLTFMTYIIGEAASGKGDYREIDRLIMEPLRQADERGRKAEEAYQEKMKQLSVSKAKKDDVPEEKHFAVRYLPTDTTLKQKLERCRYALAQFGAEQRQVACYNFETELSSKINYEKNSWNSSQDFDKKSFDCEMTGSESRSTMTTNGLVNAFFNFVVTGTPDALQKKINARNCLDGLPTRLLMGIQPPSGYRMIERSRRRRPDKDSDFLRTVGNKLMQCGWDVNLEQECNVPKAWQDRLGKKTSFADALYWWGQQKALTCELEEDKIGNYFRKRAPMIAVKLGVVDAIMNSLDSFVDEGQINLNFSSIELAIHLCDYIFESQIWYFGNLIEESLDSSAISGLKYENTKKVRGYNELPQTFKIEDVEKVFNISRKSASNYCSFWRQNGYIDKVGTRGNFKKIINVLI